MYSASISKRSVRQFIPCRLTSIKQRSLNSQMYNASVSLGLLA